MAHFTNLIGNASNVSNEEAQKSFGHLLAKFENIEIAYKVIRDYLIFTNRRLILIDVQGVTGMKIEIKSVPYKNIVAFSVSTPGFMDLNAELQIWVASSPFAIKKTFDRSVNIYEVQSLLAAIISANDTVKIDEDKNSFPQYDQGFTEMTLDEFLKDEKILKEANYKKEIYGDNSYMSFIKDKATELSIKIKGL